MNNRQTGQQTIGKLDRKVQSDNAESSEVGKGIYSNVAVAIACVAMLLTYSIGIGNLNLTHGLGVALDDGWIHLSFAKNLVNNHIWSIQPDGTSGGATSILWVLMLALGFLFSDNGPLIAMVINGGMFILLGLVILRIWRIWNPKLPNAILATILTVACGNLIWNVFTGMETMLVLLLGTSAIYFASQKYDKLAIICIFLSAVTRPEGCLVAIAILLIRRDPRFMIKLLIATGLGLLITSIWNYHLTGTILPSTLAGRRWIIGSSDEVSFNPIIIVKNFFWILLVWMYRLAEFTFGQAVLYKIGLPAVISWIIAVIAILLIPIGKIIITLKKAKTNSKCFSIIFTMMMWLTLQLLAYAIILPTRGHGGRYQPVMLLLAMIFFVAGLEYLWKFFSGKKIKALRIVPISFAILSICSLYTWFDVAAGSLENFDRVHISAAKWIDQNTPADSKIAALDIGALAYFSQREIIDLGGLIEPAAGDALFNHTIPNYLKTKKASYIAIVYPYTDPKIYYNDFKLNQLADEKIMSWEASFKNNVKNPDHHWPGLAARVLANEIKIEKLSWQKKLK